ncbi:uncharacterized protein LOC119366355 [Triticum dicoccoides]|uniref:uncharacterized protein LOC119366355 n=1 Tax=Triticum dicoccoides TaxID=85692 RepID=UPI00188DDC46|nr:uncharacterized protein LOC119366355 [Triticum dicoccoides]
MPTRRRARSSSLPRALPFSPPSSCSAGGVRLTVVDYGAPPASPHRPPRLSLEPAPAARSTTPSSSTTTQPQRWRRSHGSRTLARGHQAGGGDHAAMDPWGEAMEGPPTTAPMVMEVRHGWPGARHGRSPTPLLVECTNSFVMMTMRSILFLSKAEIIHFVKINNNEEQVPAAEACLSGTYEPISPVRVDDSTSLTQSVVMNFAL